MPALKRNITQIQSDYETLRKYAQEQPEYITEPLLDRVEFIKQSFDKAIRNNKTGLLKADAYAFFNIQLENGTIIWSDTDEDIICKSLAYDWQSVGKYKDSDDKQLKSNIDKTLSKYGRPTYTANDGRHYGNFELLTNICSQVGLSAPDTITQDTKTTDTKVKREKRLQKINDEIRTPSADGTPKTTKKFPDVAPDPHDTAPAPTQPNTEAETNAPVIGTPFLSNGLHFVLYKPSEADTKPERQAIIDKYFYEDTITLLYGQAGSYKTMFAIWEGVSLVLGKELCGMPIETTGHKVLYMSLEMTAKDIASRLNSMTKDLTPDEKKLVDENFIIISAEDTKLTAKTNNILTALADLCNNQGIDIVYIDSLADYVAGFDIRSEGDMTAIINDLRQFVLDNHVSFRIIHHGTKPTQDSAGSMAGIHTIRDLCDYVYLIKADSEKEITVSSNMQKDKSAKSRYSEPVTLLTKFVSDNGSISFVKMNVTETTSHMEKVSIILNAIREEQGITAGDLRDRCGNFKDYAQVLSGLIGVEVIVDSPKVKGQRGSNKKHYYTVDHWNEFINPEQ